MKKIGIITFHKAISYGAGFQAYALQKYLQNAGHDVEIIDYVPQRFSKFNSIFKQPQNTPIYKKILKFIPYTICKSTAYYLLMRFNKKFLSLSSKEYHSNEEMKDLMYDLYITGSDQVWNLNFDTLKNIKPYLLAFTKKDEKRISYAASIGLKDFKDVNEAKLKKFLGLLDRYQSISVREKSAQTLLKEKQIDSEWVLDPTFLLEADEWRKISHKPRWMSTNKFILVYGLYRNKELYKLANKLSKKYKCDIVNIADSYDFCPNAKNDIVVTHEELLWYLDNAECVITDSFHGTALSVNFKTPVFIFEAKRYNTRLESLIEMLGLSDRRVKSIDSIHEYKMDYTNINNRLNKLRNESIHFLQNSILK